MKKISKIISDNPRYRRYQKPLEAAEVCDRAREIAQGQYEIVSFNRGLLTVSCSSSAQAASLHEHSQDIIFKINSKIGGNKVKSLRFKVG